jgi:hypothetical protein
MNSETLVERFGRWPSFHDAEVYGVSLDSGQRSDGRTRLRLDVHVFAVEDRPSGDEFNFVNHTLVSLEFDDVDSLSLEGFGPQNVLDDLVLEEISAAAGQQVQVSLPANNGMTASFRCTGVTVIDAVPFAPGDHSVYRR